MFALYSILLFFALLIYLPLYSFRIKVLRREKLHLGQRMGFGLPRRSPGRPGIWIHAVSVGEVLSLQSLIQKLKSRHPGWEVWFSTLTESGFKVAREKITLADRLFFLPLDFGWIVRRFLRAVEPDLLILAESEFWPNLLRETKKRGVPVLSINGRISSSSFGTYRRLRSLGLKLLSLVDLYLVQTEQDKEKFVALRLPPERIQVSGNLKTEVHLPEYSGAAIADLKKSLNIPDGRKIVVAGSTRKGEEEILLRAFQAARKTRPDLSLIVAPRQPQRFREVERLCQSTGFRVDRRTERSRNGSWDILILDTIGELAQAYALCDVAFIGGSLVSWGGHNLLEPAYYRKPVFFGPHMHNFAFLAERFLQAGGARTAHEGEELVDMFLMKDERRLEIMGKKAREVLDSLQGATERTIQAIESMIGQGKGH